MRSVEAAQMGQSVEREGGRLSLLLPLPPAEALLLPPAEALEAAEAAEEEAMPTTLERPSSEARPPPPASRALGRFHRRPPGPGACTACSSRVSRQRSFTVPS